MADGSLITTAIKVTNTAVTPSVCIKINSGRRSVGCSLDNKWWSAKFPNPIELPEPGPAVCSRPSVSAQSSGEEAPRRCLHDRKRNQTQSLRINTSSDQNVSFYYLLLLSDLTKEWNENHVLKYDWTRKWICPTGTWTRNIQMSVLYYSKLEVLNNVF